MKNKLIKSVAALISAITLLSVSSFTAFADDNGGGGGSFGTAVPEPFSSFIPNDRNVTITSVEQAKETYPGPVCVYSYYWDTYYHYELDTITSAGYSVFDLDYITLYFYSSDSRFYFRNYFFVTDDTSVTFDVSDYTFSFDSDVPYVSNSISINLNTSSQSGGHYSVSVESGSTFSFTPYNDVYAMSSSLDIVDTYGNPIQDGDGIRSLLSVYSDPTLELDMQMYEDIDVPNKSGSVTTIRDESISVHVDYNKTLAEDEYVLLLPFISTSPPDCDIKTIYDNVIYAPMQNKGYYMAEVVETDFSQSNNFFAKLYYSVGEFFGADMENVVTAFNYYRVNGLTFYYWIKDDSGTSISWDWNEVPIDKDKVYYFYIYYSVCTRGQIDGEYQKYFDKPLGSVYSFLTTEQSDTFTPFQRGCAIDFSSSDPVVQTVSLVPDGTSDVLGYLDNIKPDSALRVDFADDSWQTSDVVVNPDIFDGLHNGINNTVISSSSDSNFDISSLDALFNSCSNFFDLLAKGFSILPNAFTVLFLSSIAVLIFLRIMGR